MKIDLATQKCSRCHGALEQVAEGVYRCKLCHTEVLDDYGRVTRFLGDRTDIPVKEISKGTGVPESIILDFIDAGRIEDPEGKEICQRCGRKIREGRYCQECRRKILMPDPEDEKGGRRF